MPGAFGLCEDHCHTRVPHDRLVEANPRLDIWALHRDGRLIPGTVTDLEWGTGGARLASRGADVELNGIPIRLVWDTPMEGVDRPWWQCPACGRRCRYVYLRANIACARCHGLENASDHLRRQTRGVGRVERLRRKLGDCEVKPFAPLPERPRRGRGGRSRAFHERLVRMILAEEAALLGHLQTITRDLSRRIEVRKRRGQW